MISIPVYGIADRFLSILIIWRENKVVNAGLALPLFCGIFSASKCSFDEFVGEKVVYPSYSSAILGPPPYLHFYLKFNVCMLQTSFICQA